MKNLLIGLLMLGLGLVAQAQGAATVTCGDAAPGVLHNGQMPILRVTYTPGADGGNPGLFWLSVLSQDQSSGAVLTERGWESYQGGLYPFQTRFDGGLPGTISRAIAFPGNGLTTADYLGYGVYLGHGAYTAQGRQKVAARRATLNCAKPKLVAAGGWNASYDSDDVYIWALIQKDMVDNNKFGIAMTIPLIDCALIEIGS